MSTVNEVRGALGRGWKLTPCHGKRPCLKGWPTQEVSGIELTAHAMAGGNVAVRTGAASGVVVVDLDGDVEQHAALLERLPIGPSVKTPSGGCHLYFRDPGGLKNSAGKYAEHVDIRADGGCAVLPGSRTDKG
ncbi:MAG: bifunctional DNA primase/polymerase, partial [Candidatus Hydrogenedentes bacterium]|nr:bifunctional DNA primase/polymerase [Candidatus Hydrogenedentota bacterium]